MANKKGGKKPQQGSPKAPAQPPSGGLAARAAVASDSGGTLASFFRSPLFLVVASVFIALMIAAAWFLDQRRLGIVVVAVVLLAGVVVVVFWFRKKRMDEPEPRLLNETHDVHDYPTRAQEEFGSSLITQAPPAPSALSYQAPSAPFYQAPPASAKSENAQLRLLQEAYINIKKEIGEIKSRLAELEQERQDRYYQNPKPMEERMPVAAAPASAPSKRPAPVHNSYQESRSQPIDLSSLNQTVCRFLADQSGGWDIERLVQSVRGSMDGNASIDVEHLGSHSSGEWRLVALWSKSSQEGLVLVSSGELVDDDIARYFDVGYGRRIIACKQPARVARGSGEITVLQKGRVENS